MPILPRAGVLITRPEPGASDTARLVAARGWTPVVAPVLEIAPRTLRHVGTPQAVLVTSGNALPALPVSLHATQLLAVGDATAARAKAAGFSQVLSAGKDAAALTELAAATCNRDAGALLLASGAGQGMALAAELRARGFTVRRLVAYAGRPVSELCGAARTALHDGTLRAALFFSPQTARVFMTILQRDMSLALVQGIVAVAISEATATALRAAPWRCLRIASHPTQDDVLALLS